MSRESFRHRMTTLDTSDMPMSLDFDNWETPSPASEEPSNGSRRSSYVCASTPKSACLSASPSACGFSQPSAPEDPERVTEDALQNWSSQCPGQHRLLEASFGMSMGPVTQHSLQYSGQEPDMNIYHGQSFDGSMSHAPVADTKSVLQHGPDYCLQVGICHSYDSFYQDGGYRLPFNNYPSAFHCARTGQISGAYGMAMDHVLPSQATEFMFSSSFNTTPDAGHHSPDPDNANGGQDSYDSTHGHIKQEADEQYDLDTDLGRSAQRLRQTRVFPDRTPAAGVRKSTRRRGAEEAITQHMDRRGFSFSVTDAAQDHFNARHLGEESPSAIKPRPEKYFCQYPNCQDRQFARKEHFTRHADVHKYPKGTPQKFHCDIPGCPKSKATEGMSRCDNLTQHYSRHLAKEQDSGSSRKANFITLPALRDYIERGTGCKEEVRGKLIYNIEQHIISHRECDDQLDYVFAYHERKDIIARIQMAMLEEDGTKKMSTVNPKLRQMLTDDEIEGIRTHEARTRGPKRKRDLGFFMSSL